MAITARQTDDRFLEEDPGASIGVRQWSSLTHNEQALIHSLSHPHGVGGDPDSEATNEGPLTSLMDTTEGVQAQREKRSSRKRSKWKDLFKKVMSYFIPDSMIDDMSENISYLQEHVLAAEEHLDLLESETGLSTEITEIREMRAEIESIHAWIDAHHGKFQRGEKVSIEDYIQAVGKVERRMARMDAVHGRIAEFISNEADMGLEPELVPA